MRILVTGANGYLGQGIVKAIIESGNKVIATDFKLDNVDTRATKIECDIFSIEDPYEYFEKPDILILFRNKYVMNLINKFRNPLC